MVPEIGQLGLCFAAALALGGTITGYLGNLKNSQKLQESVYSLVVGQFVFVLLAFVSLVFSFLVDDFSVAYVANHSNTILPWQYKISAVWGGHEGSLLLWIWIMTAWMLAVVFNRLRYPKYFLSNILSTLCLLNLGFLCFAIFTSNPFDRFIPLTPIEGADLNPVLQDFGLIVHPPLLYMGYVGLSIPFAFAVAGLLQKNIDSSWSRLVKPWANLSWSFLTLGILLGSWWAYYELGWGGWWFWDPVENSSFMPWLAATALVHSAAVTEKRGAFKHWTVLLALTCFSLSLLGAFIVRSGVLTSVHSFAVDPERGAYILGYLTVVVGGSLLLFALRASETSVPIRYSYFSREFFMQINNVLLISSMVMILWGTLAPIGYEVVTGDLYSIGKPFFNFFFIPLMLILAAAVGLVPLLNWKRTNLSYMGKRLKGLIPFTVALTLVVFYMLDFVLTAAVFCCGLAFWIVVNHVQDVYRRVQESISLTRSYLGMVLAHLGLSVTLIGIACTSVLSIEEDVRMAPGDDQKVGPLNIEFKEVININGPNYIAKRGVFEVEREGEPSQQLLPEKRTYSGRQVMTEAGIDPGFLSDTYISMGEPLSEGAWAVRLHYKPYVRWIWFGGLLMALGGFLSAVDMRHRRHKFDKAIRGNAPGFSHGVAD